MNKSYSKRVETLIKRYGETGYRAKLKEWGSKGGKIAPRRFDHQSAERRHEIAVQGRAAADLAILRKHGVKI